MSKREKCYLLRELHHTNTKRYSLLGGREFRLHMYICVFGFKQRKFCPLQCLESCFAGNSSWNQLQKNPWAPQIESLQQFQGRNPQNLQVWSPGNKTTGEYAFSLKGSRRALSKAFKKKVALVSGLPDDLSVMYQGTAQTAASG